MEGEGTEVEEAGAACPRQGHPRMMEEEGFDITWSNLTVWVLEGERHQELAVDTGPEPNGFFTLPTLHFLCPLPHFSPLCLRVFYSIYIILQ